MLKNKVIFQTAIRLLILTFISPSLLSGCAATGQNFSGFQSQSDNSAVIVIYRPDLFRAGGQSVIVSVDSKEVGILRNAGWLSVPTTQGEHSIKLDERFRLWQKETVLKVETKQSESIALRVLPGGMTGLYPIPSGPVMTFGPWTIQQVSNEVALTELKSLKESK